MISVLEIPVPDKNDDVCLADVHMELLGEQETTVKRNNPAINDRLKGPILHSSGPLGNTFCAASDLNAQAAVISYDSAGYVSGQNTKTVAATARGQWY